MKRWLISICFLLLPVILFAQKQELTLQAVKAIASKDQPALAAALKAGADPNAVYEGYSLLTLALGDETLQWEPYLLLLQHGANIHKPAATKYDDFSNAEYLYQKLKEGHSRVGNSYFWQVMLVARYYGQPVDRFLLDTPFLSFNSELATSFYTWVLVERYKFPVVTAAAFANNVQLLLALDIKGKGDQKFKYAGEEAVESAATWTGAPLMPYYIMEPGTVSTPRYWVEKWQQRMSGFMPDVDKIYKDILAKF